MGKIEMINSAVGRVLILSFAAIILNVVAAKIHVSTPWLLILLLLALAGSLIAEHGAVGNKSKEIGADVSPTESLLQLIIWALISTLIGAVLSGCALLLPRGQGFTVSFNGALGDILGSPAVESHWYDVISVTLILILAVIMALRRRSIAKLIIFDLFAVTGMTLSITTFTTNNSIFVTYVINAPAVLIVSVLIFYRKMIADQCRDAWGRSPSNQDS